MKTLLAILLLISNLSFSQNEPERDMDTNGNLYSYHILDYSKWVFVEYFPIEEDDNGGVDTLTMVTYNPFIELAVIDSIMKYRESKGLDPIEYDYDETYDRLVNSHYYSGMEISKQTDERIVLAKYDDMIPDCNCEKSISEAILYDSLSYDKKGTPFKIVLLDKKIKSIEVNYYQVKRRQDPNKREEHLTVKIKRKRRLLTNEYNIF